MNLNIIWCLKMSSKKKNNKKIIIYNVMEKPFSVDMRNRFVMIGEKKIKNLKKEKWILLQCYMDVCHQKINFKNKKIIFTMWYNWKMTQIRNKNY